MPPAQPILQTTSAKCSKCAATPPDTTLDTTYYYRHDDIFNVLALTDANGDIVERAPTATRTTCDDYGSIAFGAGFQLRSLFHCQSPTARF